MFDTLFPPLPMLPLAAISQLWYLLPLLVSVSLVYGATRHERMMPILEHALRFAIWILGFLGVLFVILCFVSYWL
ncbi:MAG: hypothetical protein AAF497_00630 [Planctomycetota bacterium]